MQVSLWVGAVCKFWMLQTAMCVGRLRGAFLFFEAAEQGFAKALTFELMKNKNEVFIIREDSVSCLFVY